MTVDSCVVRLSSSPAYEDIFFCHKTFPAGLQPQLQLMLGIPAACIAVLWS